MTTGIPTESTMVRLLMAATQLRSLGSRLRTLLVFPAEMLGTRLEAWHIRVIMSIMGIPAMAFASLQVMSLWQRMAWFLVLLTELLSPTSFLCCSLAELLLGLFIALLQFHIGGPGHQQWQRAFCKMLLLANTNLALGAWGKY